MTMQCWPDDDADGRAWDSALRRRLRRAVATAALAAALAGAVAIAALAQDSFTPGYAGAPAEGLAPDVPATCHVDGWWSYNPSCCCTHGWCAPIPCDAVTETAAGHVVRLPAGVHPRVASRMTVLIPRGDARASLDGRCHLCAAKGAGASTGTARCLLVPPGAV